MIAIEVLRAARAAGISVALDGEHLTVEASAPPAPALLAALKRHKATIVKLMRQGDDGWTAEDWHAYFEERADVAEFDAGLPRPQAEERAFKCCVAEWLRHHPARSTPGRCFGCGSGDRAHDPLLPYGIERAGLAWLHFGCWPSWYARRKAEAIAALVAVGLEKPANFPDDFGKNGGA